MILMSNEQVEQTETNEELQEPKEEVVQDRIEEPKVEIKTIKSEGKMTADKVKDKPEDKKKKEKKEKRETVVHSKIEVDLWRTKMHRNEWGIRLDAQRTMKDRQWSRDMDLIGTVKRDGETYGSLGLREKRWKAADHLARRFVMKLFSPSGYWRASLERLQGESFANSLATKESCPVYSCNFKHTRNLFRIKRLAHFPRFQGEVFGFSYLDENDIFRSFTIDDKRLTLGSDWYVKNVHDNVIAKIDGKFANLGGKFDIHIFDPDLAKDKTFFTILILFSSTLRFHKDIKKNIKKSLKELRESDTELKLDDSESNLYLNPRKLSI